MEQQAEFANYAWSGRGSLSMLVGELDRQRKSRKDIVGDTRELEFRNIKGSIKLVGRTKEMEEYTGSGLALKPTALAQIAEKCDPTIPMGFLSKLINSRPDRATQLMNGLWEDSPARRFIRILDGNVRAFLSDRYRVLDNHDIAFASLESVRSVQGNVLEAALSDDYMRIKFTTNQIWDSIDIARRDNDSKWFSGGLGNQEYLSKVGARTGGKLPGGPGTIHPVVTVSNSETGKGGLRLRIGILQAVCFNLATVETVVDKVHLGEKMAVGQFSNEALAAESQAIMLKIRDGIKMAFDQESFKKMVQMAKDANNKTIEKPIQAVENICKSLFIPEEGRDAILEYFLRDYDCSQYGMGQSMARYAQDLSDADEANRIEGWAGFVISSGVDAVMA